MWILPCVLIEEISAIDAMRARVRSWRLYDSGCGTVFTVTRDARWTDNNNNNNYNKIGNNGGMLRLVQILIQQQQQQQPFSFRALSVSSCLSALLSLSLPLSLVWCGLVANLFFCRISFYFLNVLRKFTTSKITAAAAATTTTNTSTLTMEYPHHLHGPSICFYRSRARDWGSSCRCVDQKVMRPFHFAPARATRLLAHSAQLE